VVVGLSLSFSPGSTSSPNEEATLSKKIKLRAYIALLVCVSILLPLLSMRTLSTFPLNVVDLLFWATLVVLAEISPITLPKGEATLSVGGVIDCSIIMLFPTPITALFGMVVGISSSIKRKVDSERFAFNVAMLAITMSVASLILEIANAKFYSIIENISSNPGSVPCCHF